MRHVSSRFVASLAVATLASLTTSRAFAGDSADKSAPSPPKAHAEQAKATRAPGTAEQDSPEVNLLEAMHQGTVSVQAEGLGDGRMTMSLTNRTSRPLRVVLPPGVVAQGATGQFGGMGGMGGGMGGMGGGMGGMGRMAATMPPMMGMMMLARMIMYFCGDPDSWDQRSLMMGMGGMGMGGMGGMGMGGMGGGMGGMMGGGMRSVPPSSLPFADLKPRQTRHLPTRLISLSSPDPQAGLALPEKGEKLRILGDIADVNQDPLVQKALKRLAADKAPTTVSQLVMWRLAGGLDWDTIAQLSEKWANPFEMTLAQDFVRRLGALPEGESGRLLFQIEGTDAAGQAKAAELAELIKGKMVLGLQAELGVPARPDGPAVAARVRLSGTSALVVVASSDGPARSWAANGKFTLPLAKDRGQFDRVQFADALAEGILNRLVRTQLVKGPREKGKLTYGIRIDNASPLILNGVAVLGTVNKTNETPKPLWGISVPPHKQMTLPASEEAVKALGLRQGIRVMAVNLSGL